MSQVHPNNEGSIMDIMRATSLSDILLNREHIDVETIPLSGEEMIAMPSISSRDIGSARTSRQSLLDVGRPGILTVSYHAALNISSRRYMEPATP